MACGRGSVDVHLQTCPRSFCPAVSTHGDRPVATLRGSVEVFYADYAGMHIGKFARYRSSSRKIAFVTTVECILPNMRFIDVAVKEIYL